MTQQPGSELADVDPSADILTSSAIARDHGESAQVTAAADRCDDPTIMAVLRIELTPYPYLSEQ